MYAHARLQDLAGSAVAEHGRPAAWALAPIAQPLDTLH